MKALFLISVSILTVTATSPPAPQTTPSNHQDVIDAVHAFQQELDALKTSMKDTIEGLSRTMMLQQMFYEDGIRSNGGSGIKQLRLTNEGTKPYYTNTFSAESVAGIHDIANHYRKVGMGDLDVVMNGVEFRTGPIEHELMKPSQTKGFNQVEPIPFPPVPPSVLAKSSVNEQLVEMRQYFWAFHSQTTANRDYRPYFKPIMCYLEGGWMSDPDHVHKSTASYTNVQDVEDLHDLAEEMMYFAHTGDGNIKKSPYLPKTIVNVTEDGMPVYAQWDYRIVCHPIQETIYLRDFALIDDLATRMHFDMNMTALGRSEAARFSLANKHGCCFDQKTGYGSHSEGGIINGLLDKIMYEIPGKDNYAGNLTDDTFNALKYQTIGSDLPLLNVARYHRMYKQRKAGAMGQNLRHRAFSDQNLFFAKTSSPEVAAFSMTNCEKDSHTHKDVCTKYVGRHTYAIPLEIIWLTPLHEWNPYNLTFHPDDQGADIVTAGGRDGSTSTDKAFNGTSYRKFYRTPTTFFQAGEQIHDPSDSSVGVLDQHGVVRRVSSSGIRTFLPNIANLGRMRTRYPIMPTHSDDSVNYKNILALQDVSMDMKKYANMFEASPVISDAAIAPEHFRTSTIYADPPGMHRHEVYFTDEDMAALHRNVTVTVFTTEDNGHQHVLEIKFDGVHRNRLNMLSCDGQRRCWDRHYPYVYRVF